VIDVTDTLIDLIRHGEPEGGRRYRGHGCDDPLSEKGWRQMWDAVGDACPWTLIISSPMRRCRAFADALAERHGLQVHEDTRLREVGFGDWEGRTRDQIEPEEYERFYDDPVNNRPVGAEPLDAFGRRVGAALDEAARRHAGEHLLIPAHAGVIRAAIGHVLKTDPIHWYRTRVPNAAITRFHVGKRGPELVFVNRRTVA